MRSIGLIISICFLLFFGLASIIPNASFVGFVGKFLGSYNYNFFGILAYIYPFLLIYPAYHLFKGIKKPLSELFAQIFGVILSFFTVLLIICFFNDDLGGFVGFTISSFLNSLIGPWGTFVFIIMILLIATALLFEGSLAALINKAFIVKNQKPKIFTKQNDKFQPSPTSKLREISDLEDKILKSNSIENLEKVNLEKSSPKKEISKEVEIKEPIKVAPKEENKDFQVQEQSQEIKTINEKEELTDTQKTNNSSHKTATGVEILSEVAENKALLDDLEKGKIEKPKDFSLPPLDFLVKPPKQHKSVNEAEIDQKISDLLDKLRKFKIEGDVVRTYSGPVVTTFEFRPAPNVKVSKILNLQDDLAMALKAQTIRIQAPIPGKDVVGIEIPNKESETIYLREILESEIYKNAKSELTIALGKDIVGAPFVTDLKKLPHLLIAGTTGSGKSVGINGMLLSLLYRNSPKTLRLIMIDPKMLEFSIYNDIPHLLTPVITEPKKAISALSNLVAEMERRYKLMAASKTKNIENYNIKLKAAGEEILPYIVIIIDELADLMMTSGKDVEFSIGRLAQMARASGIHLIVATQRPSVDVVTGLIKANLPSRISYRVGQKIDSKVILDQMGAESLLGRGDMLFTPPSNPGLVRLHAPFTTEKEIEKIVDFLKDEQEVIYDESFLQDQEDGGVSAGISSDELDELYGAASDIIHTEGKTSISYIQRRLSIGYNRAANIIEQLEANGVLSEANSRGQREILK